MIFNFNGADLCVVAVVVAIGYLHCGSIMIQNSFLIQQKFTFMFMLNGWWNLCPCGKCISKSVRQCFTAFVFILVLFGVL